MTTKDKALKLALEALEYQVKPLCMCFAGCDNCDPTKEPDIESTIAAIREALAEQPASEPWLGLTDVERAEVQYEAHKKGLTPFEFMELHEAKLREKNAQPSKPLTNEEISRLNMSAVTVKDAILDVREVEAAHGIKGDA